jgi:hypothetical protein
MSSEEFPAAFYVASLDEEIGHLLSPSPADTRFTGRPVTVFLLSHLDLMSGGNMDEVLNGKYKTLTDFAATYRCELKDIRTAEDEALKRAGSRTTAGYFETLLNELYRARVDSKTRVRLLHILVGLNTEGETVLTFGYDMIPVTTSDVVIKSQYL